MNFELSFAMLALKIHIGSEYIFVWNLQFLVGMRTCEVGQAFANVVAVVLLASARVFANVRLLLARIAHVDLAVFTGISGRTSARIRVLAVDASPLPHARLVHAIVVA